MKKAEFKVFSFLIVKLFIDENKISVAVKYKRNWKYVGYVLLKQDKERTMEQKMIEREGNHCCGFKCCEDREYDPSKEDCQKCFEDSQQAINDANLS